MCIFLTFAFCLLYYLIYNRYFNASENNNLNDIDENEKNIWWILNPSVLKYMFLYKKYNFR